MKTTHVELNLSDRLVAAAREAAERADLPLGAWAASAIAGVLGLEPDPQPAVEARRATLAQAAQARELYAGGCTFAEIARALGVKYHTARRWALGERMYP